MTESGDDAAPEWRQPARARTSVRKRIEDDQRKASVVAVRPRALARQRLVEVPPVVEPGERVEIGELSCLAEAARVLDCRSGAERQILEQAHIRRQLRMKALGVIYEISRMDFEELRQHHARGVRHVWPRAALDLRQVRLADGAPQFVMDRVDDLLLRHLASQAAQRAFDLAQVTNFLAQLHIAFRYIDITSCNYVKKYLAPIYVPYQNGCNLLYL